MKIAAHFLPLTMVIQKIGTWYILHIKQETCYLGTRNILHQQFLDQPIHYVSIERQQKWSFSHPYHPVHMLTKYLDGPLANNDFC